MPRWAVVAEHKGKRPRSVVVRAKHLRGALRAAQRQLGKGWHVASVLPGPVRKGTRLRQLSK